MLPRIPTKCDKHKQPFFSRCRQCIVEEKEQYAKEKAISFYKWIEENNNPLYGGLIIDDLYDIFSEEKNRL